MIRVVPLMGVVLLMYNTISLWYADGVSIWNQVIKTFNLPSGASLPVTYGTLFVSFALIILFVELIKSTTASNVAMVEQSLSSMVFIGFLLEFLLFFQAGEPTFLLLMLISFVEMLAGFYIITKVARRDIGIS